MSKIEQSHFEAKIIRTLCSSHCLGTCQLDVHVRNGQIIHIEPVETEAMPHRPCAKGLAYRQRVYAPDRLLYPLKRTGKRGSENFQRISWDEALDAVANALKHARDNHGPASIMHFCSMCDPYILHHVPVIHRLLSMFGGYTAPWGTISNEGLNFAMGMTYGTPFGLERPPSDYVKCPMIILWGWNPMVTMQGTEYPDALIQARENGAKIVAVDPRYSQSAAVVADRWVPVRPGTDVAVLSAMAYVIISEGLQDKEFIDNNTVGFEQYKNYVLGLEDGIKKTPEWAESISGVPATTIADLSRQYAVTKPAFLTTGFSAGRTAFGEQFHRAVAALEAITGNTYLPQPSEITRYAFKTLRKATDIPGPPNQVEKGVPPRWNSLPYRGASVNSGARVNVSSFADAIGRGKAGGYFSDYKFVWFSNTNYLNQLGNLNQAREAFDKLDFMLVTEQFMTATARLADIVLPVCTCLERNDIFTSREADLYGLVSKAMEPLGESRSQLEICEALAVRLGITGFNDKSDEEWLKNATSRLSQEAEIPDYEDLKKQGVTRIKFDISKKSPNKTAENGAKSKLFPTPSGKVEIYSQLIADMDQSLLPPIPKYIETWENLNDQLAQKYSMQLVTSHYSFRAHSQFHNLPWLQDLELQTVTINYRDAADRGITDGEMVRIFNDRGEIRIPARVTGRIMPGVVDIPEGAWYKPDVDGIDYGGCPNVLTTNRISPAGAFPSNTTLVEVSKIQS